MFNRNFFASVIVKINILQKIIENKIITFKVALIDRDTGKYRHNTLRCRMCIVRCIPVKINQFTVKITAIV